MLDGDVSYKMDYTVFHSQMLLLFYGTLKMSTSCKAESKSVIAEPEVGERTIARFIPEAQDTLVGLNIGYTTIILASKGRDLTLSSFLGPHHTSLSWPHCEVTQH